MRGMQGGKAKAKNFKGTMAKLLKYAKRYMLWVVLSMLMISVGGVLQIMGPGLLGDLTNEIQNGLRLGIDMVVISRIAWTMAIMYGCMYVLYILSDYIMASIIQKIAKSMRTDISNKINRLPFSYFHGHSYGDILSRITNDVDTISTSLSQSGSMVARASAMLVSCIIMMFYTNWILAFTAIGTVLLGFVGMVLVMKQSQKYFMLNAKQMGDMNGHIEEAYSGHGIIKVYNASHNSKKAFEDINRKLDVSGYRSQFFSGLMMPIMGFIGNLGYVAVCVVGAVLVINTGMEFGVIVAFMIYVRLFNFPLSQLAQAAQNLQRAAASCERVFEFLEEKEMEDESLKEKRLQNINGSIEFEHVKFGYTAEKTIIKDFSVKVSPGQKVAIVGPTGAGKTTIVNLLMRFYEIDSGTIYIDGIPTNQVRREDVHEQFDMVLQDTWIFEGTIKENIVYSKKGVTDEQVIEACKTVGLHHFVMTLADGYDTILNDKASLSEGQKQLLTIARAIIKNSPLLILDEATSSVDTRTERIVQAAMDRLTQGRTSFVIAHRLSTIKNADIILVMKNGDIIESGNHDVLLEKGGFYAELYNSQFEEGEAA
ncbi:MAG: ABC transporter ATP-binding protein/permease [Firmicutes bacterium]|nr:ABC transporter ATP-binding protein/permease [Bacillota bacterium]MCL1954171.1 ABC transporter ATP-binding protein/permease [Bacillota bacterium]